VSDDLRIVCVFCGADTYRLTKLEHDMRSCQPRADHSFNDCLLENTGSNPSTNELRYPEKRNAELLGLLRELHEHVGGFCYRDCVWPFGTGDLMVRVRKALESETVQTKGEGR
jgi:hypothetical protein